MKAVISYATLDAASLNYLTLACILHKIGNLWPENRIQSYDIYTDSLPLHNIHEYSIFIQDLFFLLSASISNIGDTYCIINVFML